MSIAFRQARPEDFDYCARLYFAAMDATIRALQRDIARHTPSFRGQWSAAETRIIVSDPADIGWLQTAVEPDAIFLQQRFVDAPLRCQGIGTRVMHRLIDEAARTSPARARPRRGGASLSDRGLVSKPKPNPYFAAHLCRM